MGNDIARQFAHLPEGEAVERVAAHVRSFWTPQMRANLRVAGGRRDQPTSTPCSSGPPDSV